MMSKIDYGTARVIPVVHAAYMVDSGCVGMARLRLQDLVKTPLAVGLSLRSPVQDATSNRLHALRWIGLEAPIRSLVS